jgi:hypothetical protein
MVSGNRLSVGHPQRQPVPAADSGVATKVHLFSRFHAIKRNSVIRAFMIGCTARKPHKDFHIYCTKCIYFSEVAVFMDK